VPFGVYNVTNPGEVTTRQVVELIRKSGVSNKNFEFFESEAEFMAKAAIALRSNCVMDSSKLGHVGIEMTPVLECLENCLKHWQSE
jgi:hypothetical protein